MEILLIIIGVVILVDIYLRVRAIRNGALTDINELENKLDSIDKKVDNIQREVNEVKNANTKEQRPSELDITNEYEE